MTTPVTLVPSVHTNSSSAPTAPQPISLTHLEALGNQLFQGIMNQLLYWVSGGTLGSNGLNPATATPSTQAPNTFASMINGILAGAVDLLDGTANSASPSITVNSDGTANFNNLLTSVGLGFLVPNNDGTTTSTGSTVQNTQGATGTHQTAVTNWATLLTNLGLGGVVPLIQSIAGLIPGALDALDGTATTTTSSNVTINGDGTANLPAVVGTSPLNTLINNGDGTTTSLASTLQNNSGQVGTQGNALNFLSQSGSLNVTRGMSTDLQSTVDTTINALTGGSGSGNMPHQMTGPLQTIPLSNVVPTPNPGTGSVTHDANVSGVGSDALITNTPSVLTDQWNHTVGATANCLIVRTAFVTSTTPSVAVQTNGGGGFAFSQVFNVSNGNLFLQAWQLRNPPTGSQTLSVIVQAPFGGVYGILGCSDSYIGVGSIGPANTNFGTNFGAGQIFLNGFQSGPGDMVVQAFGLNNTTTFSVNTYNQTQRDNDAPELGAGGEYLGLVAGDAAGSSSLNFTANATASVFWTTGAFNLIPIPSTAIGTGFRQYNTNTTAVNGSAGNNVLPASFFNTSDAITSDYSYVSSTNTLTVNNAAWYHVVITVLEASVTTIHEVRAVLYHNGAVAQTAQTLPVTSTASGTWIFTGAFNIYCSAGDTLQPGYWLSGAVNTVFVGEATGTQCYWEVSVMNRSIY